MQVVLYVKEISMTVGKFSSLSTLNKHMTLIQFLKLSAKFMKVADLGPCQASKLEHFGKISFS